MKTFEPIYKLYGDRSILVEWPSKIDINSIQDIRIFKKKLENNNIKEIVDINFAYSSLLINYNYTIRNIYDVFFELKQIYSQNIEMQIPSFKLWKIPVCYDEEFAVDIEVFSNKKGLSKSDIIRLHSETIYTVFFIGFLPGFLYLGGLNEKLHINRKSTPSKKVIKGSVAIGGNQTGIYPQESPGGWYVLGNSPISFFEASKKQSCFASPGDRIQFVPVSKEQYNDIKFLVDSGVYQLESEVMND